MFSVHSNTQGRRFQIPPVWIAFSKSSVFLTDSVDGKTVETTLRLQITPAEWGRGLNTIPNYEKTTQTNGRKTVKTRTLTCMTIDLACQEEKIHFYYMQAPVVGHGHQYDHVAQKKLA